MRTLGIDTSNYATSLAVFDTNAGEVVCDCKRFLPVRKGQLGLRQSDALFHHTAALPEMLAELCQKVNLTQIEAVGVSARPRPVDGSYMPCFLAGVSAKGQWFRRTHGTQALLCRTGLPVVFAGGVMSSEIVRDYITKRMQYAYFVPGKFASDNAIGVSILAAREINAWPNTSM